VLGIAFVAALVAQLARRDGRQRLTASLTATVTATVLMVCGAMYVGAGESRGGATLVATTATAAAAATLATLLRAPVGPVPLAAAIGLGAVAGALVGATDDVVGLGSGALLGVAGGLLAALASTITAYGVGSRRTGEFQDVATTAVGGALPLLLGGLAAYVLGRILVG
jgi:hypothetical protein